jgi:hypothetical protein
MKMYNNGQRPQKMYGGGMTMPRKPMMMGGLAQQNRTQGSATPKTQDAMGMMTQQKKFDMGYNLGGAIKKFEGRQKKASGDKVMTSKQKKFAALAEPRDKITYADKIAGATKKT